jgi:proteasome-associated ATPase
MDADPLAEARELAARLAAAADDPAKAKAYAAALQDEIGRAEQALRQLREERDGLAQAYEQLTAPANRLGTLVAVREGGGALIALGDTEYVVQVDPTVPSDGLVVGARVRLNEAYAVVGVEPHGGAGALAKVGRLLEDGRIELGDGREGVPGRIVGRADAVAEAVVRPGDQVRLDASGRLAVEHFPQAAGRDYFVEEVPETPWEAIGGQEPAIRAIREAIEMPMLYPEIYRQMERRPAKGVLLYGPPGCGKTLIGKAIAYNLARQYGERLGREVRECFLHISGPRILNMWLGETERMVREIFATARERAKEGEIVVVFVDEAESILRVRSSGRALNINNTVVPQFCAELDGIVGLENVVTVLTSNRPDYIDPAVLRPERIDRKVKVVRPDREASHQVLGLYLHDRLPLAEELVREHHEPECARAHLIDATVRKLWEESPETEFVQVVYRSGTSRTLHWHDFVSGALLKSLVDRAKDSAIRRAVEGGPVGLTEADFLGALADEYREGEIFPKGDAADDWIKLLDVEPETVVSVRPVERAGRGRERGGRVS